MCSIAKDINRTFDIQILLLIVINFIMVVQLSYFCAVHLIILYHSARARRSIKNITLVCGWILFFFGKIARVSYTCSEATNEVSYRNLNLRKLK